MKKKSFTALPTYLLRDWRVSRDARLLMGILRSYAMNKNQCWPSCETLCRDMGCSRSQLYRYLKELVDARWIERRPKDPTNKRSVVLYTLHDKDLEEYQQKLADPNRHLVSPVRPTIVSPVAHEVDKPWKGEEIGGSCTIEETPDNVIHIPRQESM